MCPKHVDGMANIGDPEQIAPSRSDLGLHCLLRTVCPNIEDHRNEGAHKVSPTNRLALVLVAISPKTSL